MTIQTTLPDAETAPRGIAHNLAYDRTPHHAFFLIANARLEANLNPRKESPLNISNRKWMPFLRTGDSFTHLPLISSFPWPPCRLINAAAIRNAPKALKT
jgi:hypothetical protein